MKMFRITCCVNNTMNNSHSTNITSSEWLLCLPYFSQFLLLIIKSKTSFKWRCSRGYILSCEWNGVVLYHFPSFLFFDVKVTENSLSPYCDIKRKYWPFCPIDVFKRYNECVGVYGVLNIFCIYCTLFYRTVLIYPTLQRMVGAPRSCFFQVLFSILKIKDLQPDFDWVMYSVDIYTRAQIINWDKYWYSLVAFVVSSNTESKIKWLLTICSNYRSQNKREQWESLLI